MLSFEADIPFVNELGFTLHKRADGESELHYTPRSEHLNSFGVTHGGALMALLDVTMAQAACSVVPNTGGVTIEDGVTGFLFNESTADSYKKAKRENAAAMRKSGAMGISTDGKPTKKQRRQLHQFHDASGAE